MPSPTTLTLNRNASVNIYNHQHIFIDNESTKEYYSIILQAQQEKRKKLRRNIPGYIYYESHHILPKSIFPEYRDCNWNKILLTGKEHHRCHQLLVDMTTGLPYHQMVCAFWNMAVRTNDTMERVILTADEYQTLREKFSKSRSILGQRPCSEDTKIKIGLANKGRKPSEAAVKNSVAKRLGRKKPAEAVRRSAIAQKGNTNVRGKTWWHNGIKSTMSFNCPGEEWTAGRIMNRK